MTRLSEKFERQIARIHELIEQPDSEITWNDRIPDPDNPVQARQIDITIRRDESLTLVECRIHNKKQDVKWIEELMGRRDSLNADAVIAVSASGFTEGAIAKAKARGIILRDILSLSENEIANWGKKTKVWLTFYEYKDVSLTLVFESEHQSEITIISVVNYFDINRDKLYQIFETVAKAIDEKNPQGLPCTFNAKLANENVEICGRKVKEFEFEAKFRQVKRELEIPSVVVYDSPEVNALERNVFVEAVELGDFEITQSSDRVSVALDMSPIKAPRNCHFRLVNFDFGRVITMETAEILGIPPLEIPLEEMKIVLSFR